MAVNAGDLRHQLSLQSATQTADGTGGVTESWSTEKTIWGHVRPFTSRELLYGGGIRAGLTHEVTTRYDSDITPTKRFLFGSRVLRIASLRDIEERGARMELLCEEQQD